MTLSADLTGRRARCQCGHEADSTTPGLAFLEYQGPGSKYATESCQCGYSLVAHEPVNPVTGRPGISDHVFESRGPAEFDRFYCGCRGWD